MTSSDIVLAERFYTLPSLAIQSFVLRWIQRMTSEYFEMEVLTWFYNSLELYKIISRERALIMLLHLSPIPFLFKKK